MKEELCLNWEKNYYIKVEDGEIEIRHKGNAVMNGVLGGTPNEDIVRDKIENFSLLHFSSYMGFDINIILKYIPSGEMHRIEIVIKKKDADKWKQFKDIMNRHGVFENKKRTEIFYGKESNLQKGIEQSKKEIICNEKEQKEFYEELKKLPGFDFWYTKKEIRHLKTMLQPEENVLAIASGFMEGNTWLIACTNKRIIFVNCGIIYGVNHSEIMIDKVNAVSFKNGLMFGEIHIEDGASTRIISNVYKYSTKPFVDAVHKAIGLLKVEKAVIQKTDTSVADELLKFKQLLDVGAITQEEFEEQKAKILK